MITMPGRSRVALMLLISSPRRVDAASDSLCKLIAFRKFQTAARRSDAWNNRGTPGKLLPNAKTQYKRALSSWSIVVRGMVIERGKVIHPGFGAPAFCAEI